jgi:hypothetical protein
MSGISYPPPNPYFSSINYNPSFFSTVATYLTEAIANSKYLKLIGGTLSGFLGILRTPRVELDVYGQAVINNGASGPPMNSTFGGPGTKLILNEAITGQSPIALGTELNDLWLGTSSIGNIKFYTGLDERMRILDNGNVGLSCTNITNAISSKLNVNNIVNDRWTYNHNTAVATLTNQTPTGAAVINDPVPVLNICRQGGGTPASYGVRATFKLCRYENTGGSPWSRSRMDIFLARQEYSEETNVMTMRSDGRVGIGTDAPISVLHIRGATPSILRIETNTNATDQVSGIEFGIPAFTSASSAKITSTSRVGNVGDLQFLTTNGTSSTIKMTIAGDGKTCIGDLIPTNILQVGDGARLRISNDSTDYSLIGTKTVDDTNNTSISISAYQRAGFNGRIEYNATSGGGHFFNNNGNRVIEVFNTGINILRSITTYGANYYSSGTSVSYGSKVKSGSLITYFGFFIDASSFSNCMVHFSASHPSPNYTCWHGRIIYNNLNIVASISNYYGLTMTVEEFIENGTNAKYIIVYPTISYTTSTSLRINFYS